MHWLVFMTSLCMYYALCFVHVEHSVCHEPISVSINNIIPNGNNNNVTITRTSLCKGISLDI